MQKHQLKKNNHTAAPDCHLFCIHTVVPGLSSHQIFLFTPLFFFFLCTKACSKQGSSTNIKHRNLAKHRRPRIHRAQEHAVSYMTSLASSSFGAQDLVASLPFCCQFQLPASLLYKYKS